MIFQEKLTLEIKRESQNQGHSSTFLVSALGKRLIVLGEETKILEDWQIYGKKIHWKIERKIYWNIKLQENF